MRILNLKKDFVKGWVVGNFSPSLYTSKDIEVGIHSFKKGDKGDGHYHKQVTEYNFVITGEVEIFGKTFARGDIFIIEKMERAHLTFLEDTSLMVIKMPSVTDDKFY